MSAHLVLLGPSTAGKTSLMLGLERSEGVYNFTLDKTWTTRERRPGESDEENIFVDQDTFEIKRYEFLFPFRTFPTYEYGIERPRPLAELEVRMRILMPAHAKLFRELVTAPTVFCSIAPFNDNPAEVFRRRDPEADEADLTARITRFHKDRLEADSAADILFQNCPGIEESVSRLRNTVTSYLSERGL